MPLSDLRSIPFCQQQLAALVVSRQLFRIVQETVVPYATQYVKKMHLAGKASDGGKDEDDDDDAELLSDDVKSTLSTPELESVMGTYSVSSHHHCITSFLLSPVSPPPPPSLSLSLSLSRAILCCYELFVYCFVCFYMCVCVKAHDLLL